MLGPLIWVEGLIGAGKSSVTEQLAGALNARPLYEPVGTNPFLDKFYKEPEKYAFAMQIYLLHVRYNLQNLAAGEALLGKGAIMDRGLPGDRVFCKMHIQEKNIEPELWTVYEMAFIIMSSSLRPPSLLVYLDVSPETALRRVRSRGRGCEEDGVTLDYLRKLQAGYEELLAEINSGEHAWSRGIQVLRYDWDQDFLPFGDLLTAVKDAL
jgi:deoxyadenosine/deoxycytidine kinase